MYIISAQNIQRHDPPLSTRSCLVLIAILKYECHPASTLEASYYRAFHRIFVSPVHQFFQSDRNFAGTFLVLSFLHEFLDVPFLMQWIHWRHPIHEEKHTRDDAKKAT